MCLLAFGDRKRQDARLRSPSLPRGAPRWAGEHHGSTVHPNTGSRRWPKRTRWRGHLGAIPAPLRGEWVQAAVARRPAAGAVSSRPSKSPDGLSFKGRPDSPLYSCRGVGVSARPSPWERHANRTHSCRRRGGVRPAKGSRQRRRKPTPLRGSAADGGQRRAAIRRQLLAASRRTYGANSDATMTTPAAIIRMSEIFAITSSLRTTM